MSSIRVLVIEDDEQFARLLCLHLEQLDIASKHIKDTQGLGDAIAGYDPDVVLIDVELGMDRDGISLAKNMREEHSLPVIFLTAHMDSEKVKRAGEIDNSTYMLKPPDYEELVATIQIMIQQGRRLEKIKNDNQKQRNEITSLSESNVKMALLTELIIGLKDIENKFYETEDIELLYKNVLESLVLVTDSDCGYVHVEFEDGHKEMMACEGHNQRHECDSIFPVEFIKSLDSKTIVRSVVDNSDLTSAGGVEKIYRVMAGPVHVKESSTAKLCLVKESNQGYSLSDENIFQIFTSEVEAALSMFYLLKKSQKEHAELEKERKNHMELINELQQAQDQLLQSEKMASIGQLAAGIAHEINNPVGYINSNLSTLNLYMQQIFELLSAYETVKDEIVSEEAKSRISEVRKRVEVEFLMDDLKELLSESGEGLQRVKQIVQDLKDFSHVDEAEWQWADLERGLDSTLNIVHNELKYKAKIIKNYAELPQVECIISQINQVFMNILVNAAYAIEDQGEIHITTGCDNSHVWVDIEDNGCGMNKELCKRIFDPFYTTKPVGQGTGLGLSLSYSIIQKHHGEITVESNPGAGTRFHIQLPVSQPVMQVDKVG